MSLQTMTNTCAADKLLTYKGSGACVGPRHHQPIPSQYRSGGSWVRGKKGYDLAVGEGKAYFGIPAQILLGVMSYWDDIQSKRRKDELEPLGACHKR